MTTRSLRFDDPKLQELFVSELRLRNIKFELTDQAAVESSDNDWNDINNVAHGVRATCYRGYFTWLPTPEMTEQFLNLLKLSGLSFQLEHHHDRDVFFLPRENKAAYEELQWQVYDANRNSDE
jgi:hypothetical protein